MLEPLEDKIIDYANGAIDAAPAAITCMMLAYRDVMDFGPLDGSGPACATDEEREAGCRVLYSVSAIGYENLFGPEEYPLDWDHLNELEAEDWELEEPIEFYESDMHGKKILELISSPRIMSGIGGHRPMKVYAGQIGSGLNAFRRLR